MKEERERVASRKRRCQDCETETETEGAVSGAVLSFHGAVLALFTNNNDLSMH